MERRWLSLSVLLVPASLPGCATGTEPDASPEVVEVRKVSDKTTISAEAELRLAQTLLDLDKRVDQFVVLSAQPGEEARRERQLARPVLAALVAQFEEQLLAVAADASNPGRRRIALKALAFSENPAALPVLVDALSVKGDARLLTNATYALGRLRNPKTPPEPLLALVRDPDPDVRSNALLALWHVFDARREAGASPLDPVAMQSARPLLETSLFDAGDPAIRAHAAAALGALGDARSVDPLINLLRDDHPLVRTQTAIALGKLRDEKAMPALVEVVDETPRGTPRKAVLLALTALLEAKGHHVPETLGDEERAWERYLRDAVTTPAEK